MTGTPPRPEAITRVQPTGRALVLLGLGFGPALLPILVDASLWTVWPAFLGVALVIAGYDLLTCPSTDRIRVDVDAPDCLYIGAPDPAIVRLALSERSTTTLIEVLLDLGDLLEPRPSERRTLAPGREEDFEFPLEAHRRGEAVLVALWLRWHGPLGIMRRVHRLPLAIRIPVVPDVRSVKEAAILASRTDAWSGLRRARHVGEGSEFESLREFQPGFDTRTIDWKASARHRTLLAREHRAERDRPLVIALDTGHLMCERVGDVPLLDRAINAGLHLAVVGLRVGDRVGLFAFDQEVRLFREPRAGIGTFHHLLHDTSRIEYSTAETNFTLGLTDLSHRLRRRSLVILLTDFVDTVTAELMVENLDRMARRHLVIAVTIRDPHLDEVVNAAPSELAGLHRAVVARDLVREREIVLRRLTRLGIQCIDATPTSIGTPLINRYLRIKRREMVG